MRKLTKLSTFVFIALGIGFTSCNRETINCPSEKVEAKIDEMDITHGQLIPGKFIVVLKKNSIPNRFFKKTMTYDEKSSLIEEISKEIILDSKITNIHFEQVYSTVFQGFAASLTKEEFNLISQNPLVEYIEQDRVIAFGKGGGGGSSGGGTTSQPPQKTPYGIKRVGGTGSAGNKKAWIIDSGIEFNHPDLLVNTSLSKSFNGTTASDQYGHGTHIAGIIGAKNNSIGSVGIAAGCTLVSVRVLNKYGGGSTSAIVAGIDYVAAQASSGDVANISLGLYDSPTIDSAVLKAAGKGIYFTLAAGNNGGNVASISPARVNGTRIYTVSAMDSTDNWASFSNYSNTTVDFCQPGVNIYSTYIGNSYKIMSGTSFSAPHLAGILLVTSGNPATSGYVKNDPDGKSDPIGHL